MKFLKSLDISSSGLTAQRFRMDIISNNIANVNTTKTQEGHPFRRQMAVFQNISSNVSPRGVKVVGVARDQRPLKRIFDPSHPDADGEGYVYLPNIDIMTEMVDMISATRSYEANITAANSIKGMAIKALELGR